jgi:hypothetical protein
VITVEIPRLLQNPDVVLRQESNEESALLFNPDTNQVKVINVTGLFIWQFCNEIHTIDEIVAEMQREFKDIPSELVALDTQEFVDSLLASGFIGVVETD